MTTMLHRISLSHRVAVCVASLSFSLGMTAACGRTAPPDAARKPPEVAVMTIRPEPVHLDSEWIATLDGYVNAQIRPQVSGYLIARHYREGAFVRKGDVLFEIDARPFATAVVQAKARLAEAQSQLVKATRDVARDTPLAQQRAIAQSQLDNDVAAQSSAEAAVQSAAASVSAAELNLEFTKITSLVDGVAAIATAQIGDLVGPSTLLTTVSQLDPIKAYFPLSEREYLALAPELNRGDARSLSGASGLTLILADGSVYPQKGRFLAADRDIDVKTGTIRVSAEFPNAARTLRPGQFARVRAATRSFDRAILVPQRAVTELQGTYLVRLVSADNKVAQRTVTVGDRVQGRWIIASGLAAGERVVVEGPATRDGTEVTTRPFVAGGAGSGPSTAAAPTTNGQGR